MTREEVFTYNKHVPTLPLDKPFVFGVIGLAHGHIFGMCHALIAAGATVKYVYDNDASLIPSFVKRNPDVKVAESEEEIFSDPEIELIVSADIPSERAGLIERAMRHGKDVFVDKAPVISLGQLDSVKRCAEETGRRLFVYYSEFIHVEASIFAKQLIDRGVIGKVFHIDIFAPHRLNAPTRPEWFFKREKTGGIITDIGSHQLQQFLEYTGADDATINSARVGNYFAKDVAPAEEFDDFGDLTLTASNGVTGYIRIDWNSPAGIETWGDVRATILGERGYIELRKNCDIGSPEKATNKVYVCTEDGVFTESVSGKVGFPFFSNLIKDCRERTETAMTVHQTFRAIELAIKAQNMALDSRK